ncbi:endonuclease/exonuclease/phosphatase family protein [Candidatus Woesearchaeota archaeon]|nr:endonuclease/exonuclease/phosphatase family protein [Candidatus Woesearchaeota archaeon]
MSKKGVDRRGFLQYAGLGLAAAVSGCYSLALKDMKMDCYHPAKLEDRLRVMTYNIANARGDFDDFWKMRSKDAIMYNLGMIVAMCQHEAPEVICMNEVDFDSSRTYNIDQAEYIAKGLCYNHVIKQSMFRIPGLLDVGCAVVSRYPLEVRHHQQYGETYAERISHVFKTFVDFDVEYMPGKKVSIIQTHLDHHCRSNRIREARILIGYMKKKKERFALLGDFNSGPGSAAFDMILGSGLVRNLNAGLLSFRSHRPEHSLDHILVSKGLDIRDYKTIWAEMSDHRPVIGDIIL